VRPWRKAADRATAIAHETPPRPPPRPPSAERAREILRAMEDRERARKGQLRLVFKKAVGQ
jgi:hypothetical protein